LDEKSGWDSRIDKFFEVQNVSAKDRLRLAFISTEGSENHWLKFWRQKTNNHSWEEFTMVLALIKRFGERERNPIFE